jgi:hypothetical protein
LNSSNLFYFSSPGWNGSGRLHAELDEFEGVVEWETVVVVHWEGSTGVVDCSCSCIVPGVHLSVLTTVSKSVLEWLLGCSAVFLLVVLPLWPEVSNWSSGLLVFLDFAVLECSDLMLLIWDDQGRFPDWIVDSRWRSWGWDLIRLWNVFSWGVLSDVWTLAGGNDGISEEWVKRNDLTILWVEGVVSTVNENKVLAVWKLDPSGSNTRSLFSSSLGESLSMFCKLDHLFFVMLVELH